MSINIRDWTVLLTGVILVILGTLQLTYNLESLQLKDLALAGIGLLIYIWLYYQYKFKGDKRLLDEYYLESFYKSLEYGLSAIILMIGLVVIVFEQKGLVSIHYIYGAIRIGMGLWLLYFSYKVMRG